jgi:hypothetical protein
MLERSVETVNWYRMLRKCIALLFVVGVLFIVHHTEAWRQPWQIGRISMGTLGLVIGLRTLLLLIMKCTEPEDYCHYHVAMGLVAPDPLDATLVKQFVMAHDKELDVPHGRFTRLVFLWRREMIAKQSFYAL